MKRKSKSILLLIGTVLLLLAVTTAYGAAPVETKGMYYADPINAPVFTLIREADGNSIYDMTLYFNNYSEDGLSGDSTAHVTCVVKGTFDTFDWVCHGTETFQGATLAGKDCDLTFNITVNINGATDLQGKWNITNGSCDGEPVYGGGSIEGGLFEGSYTLNYILLRS